MSVVLLRDITQNQEPYLVSWLHASTGERNPLENVLGGPTEGLGPTSPQSSEGAFKGCSFILPSQAASPGNALEETWFAFLEAACTWPVESA